MKSCQKNKYSSQVQIKHSNKVFSNLFSTSVLLHKGQCFTTLCKFKLSLEHIFAFFSHFSAELCVALPELRWPMFITVPECILCRHRGKTKAAAVLMCSFHHTVCVNICHLNLKTFGQFSLTKNSRTTCKVDKFKNSSLELKCLKRNWAFTKHRCKPDQSRSGSTSLGDHIL